jgi:hypothetical protein
VEWEWEWEKDGKKQGCTCGWHPYLVASQCDSKQIWYLCDTMIKRLRVRYNCGSEFPRPYLYLPCPRPEHHGYSRTHDKTYLWLLKQSQKVVCHIMNMFWSWILIIFNGKRREDNPITGTLLLWKGVWKLWEGLVMWKLSNNKWIGWDLTWNRTVNCIYGNSQTKPNNLWAPYHNRTPNSHQNQIQATIIYWEEMPNLKLNYFSGNNLNIFSHLGSLE